MFLIFFFLLSTSINKPHNNFINIPKNNQSYALLNRYRKHECEKYSSPLAKGEHTPDASAPDPALLNTVTETTSMSVTVKELSGQLPGGDKTEATFTMFPKLPIELRLKIWKLAFPGPRIIEIFHQYDVVEESVESGGKDGDGATDKAEADDEEWSDCDDPIIDTIYTKTPPATLLHVCQESRSVAQEKYCVPLATNTDVGHVWFDPNEDTIFVPYSDILPQDKLLSAKGLCLEVLFEIRHLAVDFRMIDDVLFDNIPGLVFLRELKLVLHNCRKKMKNAEIEFFEGGEYIAEMWVYDRGIPDAMVDDFAVSHELYPFYVEPRYRLRSMKRGGELCPCYEN